MTTRQRIVRRLQTIHSPKEWMVVAAIALLAGCVLPLFNALPGPTSPVHFPDYLVPLLGKFMCFAMVAVALDLVWGYAGILSLGHGLFFALGGYAMGMYLMRSIRGEGVYRSDLPDFMVFLDWKTLPWYWHGFHIFWFAISMAVLVPV